jgi:site-specific DNA recombinase
MTIPARCTFLNQYAAKNKISHPTSVYLREELLLAEVDAWLSRKLDPVAFSAAVREYEATRPDEPKPDESAQQEIAECEAKLRQHRAALEAGADPVLVTSWMKETQARRALAEARLSKPAAQRRRMTQEEITALVAEIGEIMQALRDADPADKAEVYSRLGLTLTYHPDEKRVAAEARPASIMYVGVCPRGDCTKKPMLAGLRVCPERLWR